MAIYVTFHFNRNTEYLQSNVGVDLPLIVPPALADIATSFSEFYGQKFSGRRLLWAHSLSRVDIRWVSGFDKKYEMDAIALNQLAVLSYLQDSENYSADKNSLMLKTNLSETELLRTIKVELISSSRNLL